VRALASSENRFRHANSESAKHARMSQRSRTAPDL
jgi:hypothetical protein